MSGSMNSRSSDGANDETGSGDDRSVHSLKRRRTSTICGTEGAPNKQHESPSRMESLENQKKMRFSTDSLMEAPSSSSQPVSLLPRPKLLPMACYRRSAEKPLAPLLPYPPETIPAPLVGSESLRSEASGASSSDDEDDESSEIDEQPGAAAALREQQRVLRELMTREHNLQHAALPTQQIALPVTPGAHHPVFSPESPEAVSAESLQDDHDRQQQPNPYSSSEGWLLNRDGGPPQWDYLLQRQQQQQVIWNDNDAHSYASSGSFSAIGSDFDTTFQHF